MLTVKCPRCKHDMLYDPRFAGETVVGKKKRCVYCGYTFTVHPDMERSRIVQVGKPDNFNMPW